MLKVAVLASSAVLSSLLLSGLARAEVLNDLVSKDSLDAFCVNASAGTSTVTVTMPDGTQTTGTIDCSGGDVALNDTNQGASDSSSNVDDESSVNDEESSVNIDESSVNNDEQGDDNSNGAGAGTGANAGAGAGANAGAGTPAEGED